MIVPWGLRNRLMHFHSVGLEVWETRQTMTLAGCALRLAAVGDAAPIPTATALTTI